MREAPSIPLVTGLLDLGATVRAFDPVGMDAARAELPDITYRSDAHDCAAGADALVRKQPMLVDLRNVYRPKEMAAARFVHEGVGRGKL